MKRAVALALFVSAAVAVRPALAADQCGSHPWCNASIPPGQRAQMLLHALTESQKISLLAGDEVTGVTGAPGTHTGSADGVPGLVPPVNFTDGTAGIRQGQATAVPVELAVAASFDPSVARQDGSLLGNEARTKGNDVLYGPTLTIMRTPLAGRTFQGLGEDPFLAARQGVGLIDGIQSQGVIADANIYLANNQEGRDPTGELGQPGLPLGGGTVGSRYTVNAKVSDRALREIYMPPFEAAVRKAHVGTVMCAYNRVNGTYNCENSHLLNDVLKRQWGFRGFVLSDYGAAHNTAASLNGGLDFEPWPGVAYSPAPVRAALAGGLVTRAQLDDHVRRYLRTLFAFGVFDRPPYADDEGGIDKPVHAAVSQRIEESAITLLKNRHGALPIDSKRVRSIAVIGAPANQFVTGGGSSAVTPYSSVSPLAGIRDRVGSGTQVRYDDGSDPARAAALAKRSDVAVVVAANYETEGADRKCLSLECPDNYGNQDALIERVAAANPRTTVVLETGGPVLTPWRDKVAGLVEAWYPGERGGTAIAKVLFGDVDPSGRLPVTFPRSEAEYSTAGDPASYPGVAENESYKEGVLVGYRWFDAQAERPAFPFGSGLSYTSFRYRGLRVTPAGNGSLAATVRAKLTNTGGRAGTDVPQLYVGMPSRPGVPQPPRQLKGFRKVKLAPGSTRSVRFRINRQSLSYWSTASGHWKVAPGCYRVMVGRSSRGLALEGVVSVKGARCAGAIAAIPSRR